MLVSSRRPRTERKSASLGAARELRPRARRYRASAERGLLAERDDALLAALAAHVHELALEVDVAEVERDRLRAAQPAE